MTRSISGTGRTGGGFGTVEEMLWAGRYTLIIIFADARGSRAEGGIIHHYNIFASGYGKAIATEQRARRWRAAITLTDDDGVIDSEDGTNDADNDNIPDCCEPDADNDGIYDGTELGKTTPISDNPNGGGDTYPVNGTDITKGYFVVDRDPNSTTLHTNDDTDEDGVDDGIEDIDHNGKVDFNETDPNDADSDDDGLKDGEEDLDGDGELDEGEWNYGAGPGETNPLAKDSDCDMLWDGDEADPQNISLDNIPNIQVDGDWYDSDPTLSDTDNDSLSDYLEVTGWNITIIWEATLEVVKGPYLEHSDPRNIDTDDDGLFDGDEFAYSADPTKSDSDSDNLNDKTEVDQGSDPIGMDGVPPKILNLECWVDPIVKKDGNNIPYLSGILIKITVDVQDPACVQYIELEIKGKTKREYLQEAQEQIQISNAIINISMECPFSEQEPLTIRVIDFCGNVNESVWIPMPNWTNFKEQHWEDPFQQLCSKKYRDFLNASILKIAKDYFDVIININEIIKNEYDIIKNYFNSTYRNSLFLYYFKFNPGIVIYNVIKTILNDNYNEIKSMFELNRFAYKTSYNLRDNFNRFYNNMQRFSKYGGSNELNQFVISLRKNLVSEPYTKMEINGLPHILNVGYGLHSRFALLYSGIDIDTDNDGINDIDEVKVKFRSSCGHNNYKGGWVAVDVGKQNLTGCGFYKSFKLKNKELIFGFIINRGITPEKYPYTVYQDAELTYYTVLIRKHPINKQISNPKEITYSLFRSDYLDSNLNQSSYLFECFPNYKYSYLDNEVNLCPGAYPIIQDIFVEVDWMGPNKDWNDDLHEIFPFGLIPIMFKLEDTGHKILPGVKGDLVNTFADHDIRLHIDDGSMGGGGPITHKNIIEHGVTGREYNNLYNNNGLEGTGNYGFTPERNGIFHYCVFAHDSDESTWDKKKMGNGDYAGDEFVIYDGNLGSWEKQVKAFLHELGHNLLGRDRNGSASHNPNAKHLDSNGHHDNSDCAMVKGHYNFYPPQNYCSKCWAAIRLDWCF